MEDAKVLLGKYKHGWNDCVIQLSYSCLVLV